MVALQRMLNDLGFDPGAVNGLFDARTARAVRDFQKNAGLTDDGVVDAGVFKVLDTYAAQTLGTHPFPDKSGGYFPEDLFSGAIVVDAAHGGRDTGIRHREGLLRSGSQPRRGAGACPDPARPRGPADPQRRRGSLGLRQGLPGELVGAKMVVSIHHAAHRSPAACGSVSYYFERLGYHSHRGRMAAIYLQRGISRTLGTCDIGEFGRSYEILRETNIPAVMLEPRTSPAPGTSSSPPTYYPATVAEAIAGALELYAGRDTAFIAV